MIDSQAAAMFATFDNSYEKASADNGSGRLGQWPQNPNDPEYGNVQDMFKLVGVIIEPRDAKFKLNATDQETQATPGIGISYIFERTEDQIASNLYPSASDQWRSTTRTIPANFAALPDYWKERYSKERDRVRGDCEALGIEWGPMSQVMPALEARISEANDAGTPLHVEVSFELWKTKNGGTGRETYLKYLHTD